MLINSILSKAQPAWVETDDEDTLDEIEEDYADITAACRATGKPCIAVVLEGDMVAAWENASDTGIQTLMDMHRMLGAYVAERVTEERGEEAAAAFFANCLCFALDG